MEVVEAIQNLQAVGDALAASKKMVNLQDRQLLARWKDAKVQVKDALAEAVPAVQEEVKTKKTRKAKEEATEEATVEE